MRKGKALAVAVAMTMGGTAFAQDPYGEMREVATKMPVRLVEVLKDEINKGGPATAITVCREKAPAMAKAMSESTGMQIRRVSLKNRNPKAVPDAWERGVLEDFDRRAQSGENPAALEAVAVTTEDGKQVRRYMKALPTQELCLMCHGSADNIGQDVAEKIKALYPEDKAVGYGVKQVRGAITIKKPVQ